MSSPAIDGKQTDPTSDMTGTGAAPESIAPRSLFTGQARSHRKAIVRAIRKEAPKLIAIAVAVEVLLQVFMPHYRNQVFDHKRTGGYAIEMNRDGYRGPIVPQDKPDDEFRILALGDSATFGTGLAVGDTWPAQLRDLAHRQTGRPVTVINSALPAANLRELTYAFEHRWADYDPDAVVLAFSDSMVALAYIRHHHPPRMPRDTRKVDPKTVSAITWLELEANALMHQACLPSFLVTNSQRLAFWLGLTDHRIDPSAPYGPMLAYGPRQHDVDPDLAEQAWRLCENDLRALNQAVADRGNTLIVTCLPTRFTLSTFYRDNEKRVPVDRLTIDPVGRLEAFCRLNTIRFTDCREPIRRRREAIKAKTGRFDPMFIPCDFVHLNPRGHAALAETVLSAIEPPAR